MGTVKPYVVACPSRERTHNMSRLLGLIPDVRVFVDKDERDDYLPHVPEDQLHLHPGRKGGIDRLRLEQGGLFMDPRAATGVDEEHQQFLVERSGVLRVCLPQRGSGRTEDSFR